MNTHTHQLDLPALDGANPLGFLAALGTLVVLGELDAEAKLGWKASAHWVPFLQSRRPLDEISLLKALDEKLRGKSVPEAASSRLREAKQRRNQANKQLKQARQKLKELQVKGMEQREQARQKIVAPAEEAFRQARAAWLAALKDAVPSPELAVGQRPDCTIEEFRSHAVAMRADRNAVAALAALGAETSREADGRISPTPFCFTTGSGHQEFLGDARQLMTRKDPTKEEPKPRPCVTRENLHKALFEPWRYVDDGLSLRWDPAEDVRYALQGNDPGPVGAHTVWMANLLAYRALVLFPCAATERGLAQAGWSGQPEPDAFTWPIWQEPLSLDTIRSLLWHTAFGDSDPTKWRQELRQRGVVTVYRSRRIKVGTGTNKKINFTPAVALF